MPMSHNTDGARFIGTTDATSASFQPQKARLFCCLCHRVAVTLKRNMRSMTPAARMLPMAAGWIWLLSTAVNGYGQTAPDNPDDTRFASYTFAAELGSGIYQVSDRTIQVYRLPLMYEWRAASAERPGVRLMLPVTVGFFDFEPEDVLENGIPTSIDTLSFLPGIELDYVRNEHWHVFPYVKLGGSFASSTEVDAILYGAGVRSELRWARNEWEGFLHSVLAHAGANFRGDLPGDSFTRLRNGVEMRRGIGQRLRTREVEIGLYSVVDVYFDSPEGPASGLSTEPVQLEAGVMLGVRPMWQVRGFTLPRIGLGYRVAGNLSAWRIVIGAPF